MAESEDELKTRLGEPAYRILRQGDTEPPFSGELLGEHRDGKFYCKVCGAELFDASAKFDSGTGWPSFTEPAQPKSVSLSTDRTLGGKRTEVSCANCGSHLGHVFDDGPQEQGGKRYCMNSACFNFQPKTDGE